MELALSTGMAILGYELTKGETSCGEESQQEQQELQETVKSLTAQFNNKVAVEFRNPNVVMDTQQPAPFFTSERNQNSNDTAKNRSLGTFTGHDPTYIHKREVKMFEAANKTYVHGNPSVDNDRLKKYQETLHGTQMKLTNLLPFEQIRVGRGVGLDPHQTAGGGFHESFRIMLDNVNGYRKNNFAARVVPGKAVNDNRTQKPFVESKQVDKKGVFVRERLPVQKGQSAVTAQTTRPETLVFETNRGHLTPNFGANNMSVVSAPETYSSGISRHTVKSLPGVPVGPVSGTRYSSGKSDPQFLTHPTNRGTDQDNAGVLNVSGYAHGSVSRDGKYNVQTLRGVSNETSVLNAKTGVAGHTSGLGKSIGHEKLVAGERVGGFRASAQDPVVMFGDTPTAKQEYRGGVRVQPAKKLVPSQSQASGLSDVKGRVVADGRLQAAGRMNVPLNTSGATWFREDANGGVVVSNASVKSTKNFENTVITRVKPDKSVPTVVYLDLAKNQFKTNPFHVDISAMR